MRGAGGSSVERNPGKSRLAKWLVRLKGLLDKSHKVVILELSEFGPNRRGNWASEKLFNIGVNALQRDDVGNLCRVIGGVRV